MTATVNGELRELSEGTTLASLLRDIGLERRNGIAVAVNDRVVRAATFEEYELHEGDAVEIIRAVAGG